MVTNAGKILLIEDNEEDSTSISNLLKENGYNTSCVDKGRDGLKQLKEERFDLLILDLLLPDMKGEDICMRLKNNRKLKNIPIIVLSVKDDIDDIEELFEKGIDDYIIKPPRLDHLMSRVQAQITKKRLKK